MINENEEGKLYLQLSHHLNESSVREEPSPGRGRYDERYITLQSIGKGAFGFVKVGQRRTDGVKVTFCFVAIVAMFVFHKIQNTTCTCNVRGKTVTVSVLYIYLHVCTVMQTPAAIKYMYIFLVSLDGQLKQTDQILGEC